jgi:hypothetical protein
MRTRECPKVHAGSVWGGVKPGRVVEEGLDVAHEALVGLGRLLLVQGDLWGSEVAR